MSGVLGICLALSTAERGPTLSRGNDLSVHTSQRSQILFLTHSDQVRMIYADILVVREK
jgi:hypothetical protein